MLDRVADAAYALAQYGGAMPPHAVCLLQDPALLALTAVTHLGVALAYFAIPLCLARLLRQTALLPFRSVLVMFVLFILACGASHLTKVLTLFVGGWAYWLDAAACSVTLIASLATALGLLRHGSEIAGLAGRLLARSG
ncbi:hypothetical protein [Roseomonas sp. USHLN139]|uniref:hypothetical protein n=1 Tax=Roseomonas sp. USHLN139 TaxID=3081298 RepID=UPI003B011242